MRAISKLGLSALAAIAVTAVSSPRAEASHIFFSNVKANGVDLFSNSNYLFTTSLLTFTADVTGETGETLEFRFAKTGGTATTPADASLNYGTTPSSVSLDRAFDGSFEGSVTLDISGSFPDYLRPDDQSPEDSFTFTFRVAPGQGEVIPEPGTYALLASGLLPLAGTVLRRRRA